jgi:hypothetical protein
MLELFCEFEELDKAAFTEFTCECAHIQLSDNFVDEIFSTIDVDGSTTIQADELRGFLTRVLEERHVTLGSLALHRDLAFVCTVAYFLGGFLFFILASLSLQSKLADGRSGSALVTDFVSMLASTAYCVGGVGFGVIAVRSSQLKVQMIRERELLFYSQIVDAGRMLLKDGGKKQSEKKQSGFELAAALVAADKEDAVDGATTDI